MPARAVTRKELLMSARGFNGVLLSLFAIAVLVTGCNRSDSGGQGQNKNPQVAEKKGHDHSGWWCEEHGIPEAECSMCDAKVAKAFKDQGDWCEKHDRAKSQCFICDPSLKEKYAAKYRAKYGKEPPPIEEEKEKKDDKK
jgi:hypothetical protein